jgi:hypothetical protein
MAAANFGSLQTSVAKRLIDPNSIAVSPADVQQSILDAISFWKPRKFFFNQATTNLTMDVNDPYVLQFGNTASGYPSAPVLPNNFLVEDEDNGFVIPYNEQRYEIKKKPPRIYDEQNIAGVGLPYIYTYRAGNYEFYWYPQIAYTLTVYYIKDYPDLVNPTDTNDFTKYAANLLIYEAVSRVLSDVRLDDDRAARFKARALEEYENIKGRSFKQNATGQVTAETILA